MSVLTPFLKIGVTFALFHEMGTVLVTKLRLKIFSKPLMIAGPAREIIVLDIPSGPAGVAGRCRDSINMLYIGLVWDVREVFCDISANIYKILVK